MITVYSKNSCPKCDEIKDWLDKQGHTFIRKDITNDLVMLQKLRSEHPGAGFPVVDFGNGEVIAGDLDAIKAKAMTL